MVNRANGRALNGFKLRLPKPDFFPHTIQYTLKMEKIVQKKVFIYKFNNYNVYNAIESSRFFFKFHPLMTNSTKSFLETLQNLPHFWNTKTHMYLAAKPQIILHILLQFQSTVCVHHENLGVLIHRHVQFSVLL